MANRLIRGDCLRHLDGLDTGSISAVIMDPPYGIAFESHGMRFKDSRPIDGDETTEIGQAVIDWALGQGLCVVAFASPYKPWAGKWRNWLAWDKGGHVGIGGDRETCWKRTFEMIGVTQNKKLNGKRDSAVISIPAVSPPPSGHFAEKPVPLMEYLVEKVTQPGDYVLDPFMGSGATGVACVQTGRQFVGIEIEADYFTIAQRRIIEAERDQLEAFHFARAETAPQKSQVTFI